MSVDQVMRKLAAVGSETGREVNAGRWHPRTTRATLPRPLVKNQR